MAPRSLAAIGALLTGVAIVGLGLRGGAQPSTSLRTLWGEPDLQGIWDHKITTPLERPAKFADREFLTDEEVAALDQTSTALPVGKGRDVRVERGSEVDVEGAYTRWAIPAERTAQSRSAPVRTSHQMFSCGWVTRWADGTVIRSSSTRRTSPTRQPIAACPTRSST